jgi:surface polysaccharide O-acyltransferase-like enzyme
MVKEIHSAVPQQGESLGIGPVPGVNQAAGRISFLDGLKATGIVMVVAVHALSRVALDAHSHEVMMFLVGTVAVPLFFVADGFLFAHKWTGHSQFDYTAYLRKNALRLLLPWAAFTSLYAVIRIGLESKALTRDTILLGNDLPGIAKVLYLSGLSHHMYFLLSLFVVRLGISGVSRMLQRSRWVWLVVCVAYIGLYVSGDVKRWFFAGADPLLLACWGLQFFLLGVVLQKWHGMLKPRALWVGAICLGVTAGLWGTAPRSLSFLTQLFYLVGSYAMVLAVAERTNWGFSMGNDTMGIYLLHAPYVIWAVAAVLTCVRPPDEVSTMLSLTALTVLLSWLLTRLMGMNMIGRFMLGQDTTQFRRGASS